MHARVTAANASRGYTSNMSSNQSFSSSASYSYSSSSSRSNNNGQATGQASMQQTYTDPSGNTHVKTSNQALGQPVVQDSRSYDAQGQELAGTTSGGSSRITDVSDSEQAKRDAEYEERMEDE